jgi:predicted alpha/beta hydrolase family esterase
MTNKVLFIQGAGTAAHKEDESLAASLQQLLGEEYDVHFPLMQDEADARYEVWKRQIQREVDRLGDGIILVGHSVGASVLLKCVAEGELKTPFAGIFLIGTPFWGGSGWTYEGYEELVLPRHLSDSVSRDAPVFLYHSRDDEVVPFAHLASYAEALSRATVRELDPPRGHQLNSDLSEVAADIKHLPR